MNKKHPRPPIDVLTEPPTFGSRLRQLRLKAGYKTRYALAKAHDFDQGTLSRLEADKNKPSFEMVQRLARALGVTTDEFTT